MKYTSSYCEVTIFNLNLQILVSESASIQSVVYDEIIAKDNDATDDVLILHYSINNSTTFAFYATDDPRINVTKQLDYETKNYYEITMQVQVVFLFIIYHY